MKTNKEVLQEIEGLETKLLTSQTRKSEKFLNEILADEFIEFGSSGNIYNKQQIIEALQNETTAKMILSDFNSNKLSEEYFLVTYKVLIKKFDKDINTLRSSIWKFSGNRWEMVFHQGTIVKTNE